MGAEKFTPMDQKQYNLLKGLYNASHTDSFDTTTHRVIRGFERGSLREARLDGLGEVAEEVLEEGRKQKVVYIKPNGKRV